MEQGKKVAFMVMPGVTGVGKICGIAVNGLPVVGRSFIIEILSSEGIDAKIYPYTHMTIFESMITGEAP